MINSQCRPIVRRRILCHLALSSSLLVSTHAFSNERGVTDLDSDGALDRSYPALQRVAQPAARPVSESRPVLANTNTQTNNGRVTALFDLVQIRSEVQREQTALEQLNRITLQNRAQQGERAAQIALGVDFARESMQLGFAPAAANDALSDALRWYSLAARRGFPGAPSLDQSGVRFFPVRATRTASN